jgi:AcrR family transcriptional regulator
MIEAAIELLNSVGMRGTTLKAIGEKAGYSRGLATHHFGSKAGLFRSVLKKITAAWTDDLSEQIADKSGLNAITAASDAHLDHVLRNPDYIRAMYILWFGALDPASEFKPNLAEFMRIQRKAAARWVRQGQKGGEIKPQINAERYAEQYYGALLGINHQWLVAPAAVNLEAAYENFKANAVRLLSAG